MRTLVAFAIMAALCLGFEAGPQETGKRTRFIPSDPLVLRIGGSGASPLSPGGAGIALGRDGANAYILAAGGSRLMRVSSSTAEILGTIDLILPGTALVLSPDEKSVAVLHGGESRVTMYDGSSLHPQSTLVTSAEPVALHFSSDGKAAFILTRAGKEILMFDLDSLSVIRARTLDYSPSDMQLTRGGVSLVVSSQERNRLAILDAASFVDVGEIPVSAGIDRLAFITGSPGDGTSGDLLIASSTVANQVRLINANQFGTMTAVDLETPESLRASAGQPDRVFVLTSAGRRIQVLDTNPLSSAFGKIIATIRLASPACGFDVAGGSGDCLSLDRNGATLVKTSGPDLNKVPQMRGISPGSGVPGSIAVVDCQPAYQDAPVVFQDMDGKIKVAESRVSEEDAGLPILLPLDLVPGPSTGAVSISSLEGVEGGVFVTSAEAPFQVLSLEEGVVKLRSEMSALASTFTDEQIVALLKKLVVLMDGDGTNKKPSLMELLGRAAADPKYYGHLLERLAKVCEDLAKLEHQSSRIPHGVGNRALSLMRFLTYSMIQNGRRWGADRGGLSAADAHFKDADAILRSGKRYKSWSRYLEVRSFADDLSQAYRRYKKATSTLSSSSSNDCFVDTVSVDGELCGNNFICLGEPITLDCTTSPPGHDAEVIIQISAPGGGTTLFGCPQTYVGTSIGEHVITFKCGPNDPGKSLKVTYCKLAQINPNLIEVCYGIEFTWTALTTPPGGEDCVDWELQPQNVITVNTKTFTHLFKDAPGIDGCTLTAKCGNVELKDVFDSIDGGHPVPSRPDTCVGEAATFKAESSQPGHENMLLWQAPGASPDTKAGGDTFTTHWNAEGVYLVGAPCGPTDDMGFHAIFYTVLPAPTVTIIGPQTAVVGRVVGLTAVSSSPGGIFFDWQPAANLVSSNSVGGASFTSSVPATLQISVSYIDPHGCFAKGTFTLKFIAGGFTELDIVRGVTVEDELAAKAKGTYPQLLNRVSFSLDVGNGGSHGVVIDVKSKQSGGYAELLETADGQPKSSIFKTMNEGDTLDFYVLGRLVSRDKDDVELRAYIDGSLVKEEPFTVIRLVALPGESDDTGRGKIGRPRQVLGDEMTKGFDVMSNPIPMVTINSASFGGVHREGTSGPMKATVTLSGTVTFPLADVVPNNAADPQFVRVRMNGDDAGTVSLSRSADSTSLLRPHAATFSFSGSVQGTGVILNNVVEVICDNPLPLKNAGYAAVSCNVLPEGGVQHGPELTPQDFVPFLNPLNDGYQRFTLNLSAGSTLQQIENAGQGAVLFSIGWPDQGTAQTIPCGLTAASSSVPLIADPTLNVIVRLLNTGNIGLGPQVRGSFLATVELPGAHPQRDVFFMETTASSSIYEGVIYRVTAEFTDLTDASVDKVKIAVLRTVAGVSEATSKETVIETGPATGVFERNGFRLTTLTRSLNPNVVDTISITLLIPGEGSHVFTLTETGPATRTFIMAEPITLPASFGGTPLRDNWARWTQGPWVGEPVLQPVASGPGPFHPIVFRVLGPDETLQELASSDTKVEIFGVQHSLVISQGICFVAGAQDEPGVWVINELPPEAFEGDVYGGGYIKGGSEGFVFGTMTGSKLSTIIASSDYFYAGAKKFFDMLLQLGDTRRAARMGANPPVNAAPSYYKTPESKGYSFSPTDFPFHLWSGWYQPVKDANPTFSAADVQAAALWDMTRPAFKKDPQYAPAGFADAASAVYRPLLEKSSGSGQDVIRSVASPRLIGHWFPQVSGQVVDFSSQTQTITQILHFNTGMDFGRTLSKIDTFIPVFELPQGTPEERKTRAIKIIRVLVESGEIKLLAGDAFNNILKESLDKYDTGTAVQKTEAEANLLQAFRRIERNHTFIEFSRIGTMIQAWRRPPDKTRDTLDLALAYDIASGEGFDLFGIDSYSDIISTEAGALFGEKISRVGGVVIASPDTMLSFVDSMYVQARNSFIAHPIFSDRKRVLGAFLSTQFYQQAGKYVPPRVKFNFTNDPEQHRIYKSTLGMILDRNKGYMATADDREKFVSQVKTFLETLTTGEGSPEDVVSSGDHHTLRLMDARALHEMIEMLSFIGEGR